MQATLSSSTSPSRWKAAAWPLAILLALALFPPVAAALGLDFYIGFVRRVLVVALAAASLNFIMGFGGMVALGHAGFMGVGAYAVVLLSDAGFASAWVMWPAAALLAAFAALVIGSISLRTKGVYFIMITLAFAQMLFYLMVSLKSFGGEDGLSLATRSQLGGGLDLASDTQFYFVVLALCVLVFVALQRLLNARFGHVLQGIRENETRMAALGFPVYRYRLIAFSLAGAIAGLAGALLANQGSFVSPALMQWSQSGMLMVMVILGGVGHLYGGLAGAVLFLLIEEVLVGYTMHWQLGLGAVLLAVVLVAPNGLMSLGRRHGDRP